MLSEEATACRLIFCSSEIRKDIFQIYRDQIINAKMRSDEKLRVARYNPLLLDDQVSSRVLLLIYTA